MNKKLVTKYLILTFLISYGLWGTIIIVIQFGFLRFDNPICMFLLFLGALAPAISSYIVQKENGLVTSVKDFIKKSFQFKDTLLSYGLVIFFLILYFIYPAIRGQITIGIPIYFAILMIPLSLLGGGMEEVGWRWILQPQLEKKFPFTIASIITTLIWVFWHIPLFFIEGSSQSYVDFWAFLVLRFGMAFALATIYEYSKNIWLCILMHCLLNAIPFTFEFKETFATCTYVSIIMIVGALIIRQIFNKKLAKSSGLLFRPFLKIF